MAFCARRLALSANKQFTSQSTCSFSTSTTSRHLSAKSRVRAIQQELQKGSRSISGSQSKKAAAAASRPRPAPSFQQPVEEPSPSVTVDPLHPTNNANALDSSFVGLSGGEIFHEMMLRHNVKHVFGYPGGAILPVFDAIYNSKHFDFVLPRHEQGAGHMAEGYARASGKPGVVLVTSGPGATNAITAIQDAYSDGTPMVVFTGQVATAAIGSDAFQEADVIGISRSCTKWNVMVKDINEVPRRINEAFEIATSGRPGPVVVDLPKDITASILRKPIPMRYTRPELASECLPSGALDRIHRSLNTPAITPTSSSALSSPTAARRAKTTMPEPDFPLLKRTAEMIAKSKKPIIYAGQGVLANEDGPKYLAQLAEKANIPVTTTLQGLGAFDEQDKRSLHMIGMHGSAYANYAMQEADCVIALGARFDDRVTGKVDSFAPNARKAALEGRGGIIHFEIQPKNINKVVDAQFAIEGDVAYNLGAMLPFLPETTPERKEWMDQIDSWKKDYPFFYVPSKKGELMKPQEVIEALDKWSQGRKDDVIIGTGVGQHQMWAAQHYRWTKPRSMVTSGGLGTMGFGLPASMGAKVAQPDKIVVDIDGDASFSMTAMEMATASAFNIGVKILLLNNEFQGMVLQWQDLFYEKRYSHTAMVNPDFVKLAQSMGVHAIRCDNAEDLPAKMKEFMEYDNNKPILFEARTVKNEHVFPMVPAGKALHQQFLHPQLETKF